jgi:hypothetical protein
MHPPRANMSLLSLSLGALLILISLQPAFAKSSQNLNPEATIDFANPGALKVRVGEGDDFATQVLGDPWDMNERRDIQFEIAFNDVHMADGVWASTFRGKDQAHDNPVSGYFYPLFHGIPGQGNWIGSSAAGAAIDTSKYTRLTMRVYTSTRERYGLFWMHNPNDWKPSGLVTAVDGCADRNLWPSGWHIYHFDLNAGVGQRSLLDDLGEGGGQGGLWQAGPYVYGLRFDAGQNLPAGTEVKVDWIRLTDPSSSPEVDIRWNTSGAVKDQVVEVRVATRPDGKDSLPLVRNLPAGAGGYNLPTSILAPGQYYFQLAMVPKGSACSPNGAADTTGWVGPLTVEAAPGVIIDAPSTTSGEDYGTSVLGDPWDMSNPGDVITPDPATTGYADTQINEKFENGVFSATAVRLDGQPHSDAQVWLNIDKNRPVDAGKYRYFTVRYKPSSVPGQEIQYMIQQGWGARVVWWTDQNPFAQTKYLPYTEDWHTYTLDLKGPGVQQDRIGDNPPWGTWAAIPYLRFDTMEAMDSIIKLGGNVFSIDWVKLTAIDTVKRGQQYPVQYRLDSDKPASLTFFYDDDRNPRNGRTSIGQENSTAAAVLPEGEARMEAEGRAPQIARDNPIFLPLALRNPCQGSCSVLNTANIPPGEYYICIEARDAYNTTYRCSDAPLQITP